jgi:hypothetical protein
MCQQPCRVCVVVGSASAIAGVQSAEWRECRVERVQSGESAECRAQSAERRAQSAECLEGTVCRAIKVGARILEEAQAGAQPETVFVSRAGTG